MQDLWRKFESHLLNEQVSLRRKLKLRNMYNVCSRALNLEKATRSDIEKFIDKLNRNEFKTLKGTNYSGNAKLDIKKFLKQFYRWLRGDNEAVPKEVAWIKSRISKEEMPIAKDVLSKPQVVQLAQKFKKYDYYILTIMLFDSGFRIGEMQSAQAQDLTFENVDDKNTCFFIKCRVSKTYTRTVDIPLFTNEYKQFFNSETYRNKKPTDPLFDLSYNGYRKMLHQYGKQLFNLKILPHNLRHSSATYYADVYQGNVIRLATRYGWTFSAKELQTYVRASKTAPKESAKITFKNELLELKEENAKLWDELTNIKTSFKKYIIEEIKKAKKSL